MKLAIFFLFFAASETRRQESLPKILNVIEKCLPTEKYVNLKFVSLNNNTDETLQIFLNNFVENTDRFVSSER